MHFNMECFGNPMGPNLVAPAAFLAAFFFLAFFLPLPFAGSVLVAVGCAVSSAICVKCYSNSLWNAKQRGWRVALAFDLVCSGGWPRLLTRRCHQQSGCPVLAFFARAGVVDACASG